MKKSYKRILLVVIWLLIVVYVFLNKEQFTAERIMELNPQNRLLSVLFILGIYVLKCVSIVIHNGVVYTATGMLFPYAYGIILGILGTAVMMSVPYFIGSRYSAEEQSAILEKYPKLKKLNDYKTDNEFKAVLLIRLWGLGPVDIISAYMGMKKIKYLDYLLASVIAYIPGVFVYVSLGYGGMHENKELIIAAGIVQVIRLIITGILSLYLGKNVVSNIRKKNEN